MAEPIQLPDAPPEQRDWPVRAWSVPVMIPTYEPLAPGVCPMFLDRRVYQGSSGRAYPLPVYDRIEERTRPRAWQAIHIENDFLRVMVLPEIGGRIHVVRDKTSGEDLVYRQDVIKPALVGLAGPWVSGGIEFNWPQHHRPATFMPVNVHIERGGDGSQTIWCGDHDPLTRMSGLHGVCLRPGDARLELKMRLHNRTPHAQTFLWWANVATRVHERYQSFFPPDVNCVADHARRAMSAYPLCNGSYYGVDYARRAAQGVPKSERPTQFAPTGEYAANDLSWYANIPVPTSYMCVGSKRDFFGGYDHASGVGLLHIADHRIAPGKKQWTWGNHAFGYAWDRNLTDAGPDGVHAPYIELMAGVFTDNQPDFSFLAPGEMRTFTQCWWPLHAIGPVQEANAEAAVSVRVAKSAVRVGVCVSRSILGAMIEIGGTRRSVLDLSPGKPWMKELRWTKLTPPAVRVVDAAGREVLAYTPSTHKDSEQPKPATEPLAPEAVTSADELYLTGVHLDQYRHATRAPEAYWREALCRDPLDSRCNTAMGDWHLRRGEFELAERHFRAAIERLTARNANPRDGEALYGLGVTLRHLGRDDEAYDALYKATWNNAWQGPAFHAIAEIDAVRGQWTRALEHVERSLLHNADNLRAIGLQVIALRKLGRDDHARDRLAAALKLNPLDALARVLSCDASSLDASACIDVAIDFARAGQFVDAITILHTGKPGPIDGTAPMLQYYLAYYLEASGQTAEARAASRKAKQASPDYCFPSRLEDIAVLRRAIERDPTDARAPYYLGNLFYDRRRREEAISLWERSARLDPSFPIVWRNLGIAYFNVRGSTSRARSAYAKAFKANPRDARLLFELDQLEKRAGASPASRLKRLQRHQDLVRQRDDLSVEQAELHNQTGNPAAARSLLDSRRFQPWEGGEGRVLGQHVRTQLSLGRRALKDRDPVRARACFEAALVAPDNLGEAHHLLVNLSNVYYWIGIAARAAGDVDAAKRHFQAAADREGDFQQMAVEPYSEMTFFSALAARELRQAARQRRLLSGLLEYARSLRKKPATIDYFATSLPTLLLFEDDLSLRQRIRADLLEGLALLGLGKRRAGVARLHEVLAADPNHELAMDVLADGGMR